MKAWMLAVLGLALLVLPGATIQPHYVQRVLFSGGNTDSLEQASFWVDVHGANRITFRTWSTHAAFAADGADSSFSDSITTFTVLFSDSITHTTNGYPVAADSVVVNPAVALFDSTKKQVGVYGPLPINKALRAPVNGSGIVGPNVFATTPGAGTLDNTGVITARYMRVKVTPLRRLKGIYSELTEGGFRVNGLKGFRMVAYIYYPAKR